MKINNRSPARLPQRDSTSQTPSAPRREEPSSRSAPRDGFENTVSPRNTVSPVPSRAGDVQSLTQEQVAEVRAENDKGALQLQGRSVQAKGWNPFKALGKAAKAVGNAVTGAAKAVGNIAEKVVSVGKSVLGMVGLGPQPDRQFDGRLVGAGNQTFAPGTPLSQIPAVVPRGNPNATETVIYVNGISTHLAGQGREMQDIADSTNMRVIGIHNSTEGNVADVIQCVNDKLDKGRNPAVDTLADTVYAELKAGRSVHLMGYSQGGLITARALKDVANRLRIEDGLSRAQVEQRMSRINVETFGSAGAVYPDGPNYVHYINDKDIVPMAFGLGIPLPDPLNLITNPGRGAVVHRFSEKKDPHDLDDTYLMHRVPFDQARAGRF